MPTAKIQVSLVKALLMGKNKKMLHSKSTSRISNIIIGFNVPNQVVIFVVAFNMLQLVSYAFAEAPTSAHLLFSGRGFEVAHCYKHPARRHCKFKSDSKGSKCELEVFPDQSGTLFFGLDEARDALIEGTDTEDYGIFSFRYILDVPKQPPTVKIFDVSRVPLKDWSELSHVKPMAREIECPMQPAEM